MNVIGEPDSLSATVSASKHVIVRSAVDVSAKACEAITDVVIKSAIIKFFIVVFPVLKFKSYS